MKVYELATLLAGSVEGNGDREVFRVAPLEEAAASQKFKAFISRLRPGPRRPTQEGRA